MASHSAASPILVRIFSRPVKSSESLNFLPNTFSKILPIVSIAFFNVPPKRVPIAPNTLVNTSLFLMALAIPDTNFPIGPVIFKISSAIGPVNPNKFLNPCARPFTSSLPISITENKPSKVFLRFS